MLRLASAHRLAPPEFRVFAEHLAGLDAWYAEFGGVFAPAAEAFHRCLDQACTRYGWLVHAFVIALVYFSRNSNAKMPNHPRGSLH